MGRLTIFLDETMSSDFELSFDYREGLIEFTLLQFGRTRRTKAVKWTTVKPMLEYALAKTRSFDNDAQTEDELLEPWTNLIERVIGKETCKVILQSIPARLTITVGESVPNTYYDLFRIAPFDVAIARIGGEGHRTDEQPAVEDKTITVIDVRIAEEDLHYDVSVGGIEQVPSSLDYYSEKEDEEATGTLFPVWFGTNRRLTEKDGEIFELYEQFDADQIHLGRCEVWIPKSHRRGELKSPLYDPSRWFVDDAIRFRAIRLVDDLSQSIRESIQSTGNSNHLLYVHGFNNSFSDAILRAAQIGFDLGINGATIAFSWPSRKLIPYVSRYVGDGEIITASEHALELLAERLSGLDGTLHVIAHSMGNRAFTQTWKRVFEIVRQSGTLDVGQAIFAAPDVIQDTFRQRTKDIHEYCKRATVYANRRDYALGLSRILSQTPRAGSLPPVMDLERIDTIEVPFNMALFGHTYFAKLVPMLEDLAALIEDNLAPGVGRRESLVRVDEKLSHWQLSQMQLD